MLKRVHKIVRLLLLSLILDHSSIFAVIGQSGEYKYVLYNIMPDMACFFILKHAVLIR